LTLVRNSVNLKLCSTYSGPKLKNGGIENRDQLLEDQVEPLIFVAITGESSSEFDFIIYFLLTLKYSACNFLRNSDSSPK
jgi:hypothetical protein